jgi:uroporphyrinogen-III synthase
VADIDGKKMIRLQSSGPALEWEQLGGQLAARLITAGARDLLPKTASDSGTDLSFSSRASMAHEAALEKGQAREDKSALDSKTDVSQSPDPSTLESTAQKTQTLTPLAGKRIIVTRAAKQSNLLNQALLQLGAELILCPTIEIKEPSSWEQLDRALVYLSWYDWIVFTSANGVEYFLGRLDELGHQRAELISHRICAIGRKTAEKLKVENIIVDLMPEKFTAESLVETFIKTYGVRQRLRGSRMLLPASRTTRDVIRPALEKIGVYVEVVEAYQTVLPPASSTDVTELIQTANADYIIFTSPSTVAHLAALLETDHLAPHLANTRIACIGPVTSGAARLHGLDVHLQPDEHTGQAIVMAIVTDCLKRMEKGKERGMRV